MRGVFDEIIVIHLWKKNVQRAKLTAVDIFIFFYIIKESNAYPNIMIN